MTNPLALTLEEIDALWEQGFRPYEIYTKNETEVEYFGETMPAGSIDGWEIKHIFAKRESLNAYPFFDAVICGSDVSTCSEVFKGDQK